MLQLHGFYSNEYQCAFVYLQLKYNKTILAKLTSPFFPVKGVCLQKHLFAVVSSLQKLLLMEFLFDFSFAI